MTYQTTMHFISLFKMNTLLAVPSSLKPDPPQSVGPCDEGSTRSGH